MQVCTLRNREFDLHQKRIQSHGLRPWEGKWEGRSRAPPYDPLGPEGPRPHEWVHRTPDRTQPGQLHLILSYLILRQLNPSGPMALALCVRFYAVVRGLSISLIHRNGTPWNLFQMLISSNPHSVYQHIAATLNRFVNDPDIEPMLLDTYRPTKTARYIDANSVLIGQP